MIKTQDMATVATEVAARLKLISHPNRLMIACRLIDAELSVGEIEAELGIRQPNLSRELGRLRDEGVLTARRQSKVVFYSLTDPKMALLVKNICAAVSGQSVSHHSLSDQSVSGPVTSDDGVGSVQRVSFNPQPKFTEQLQSHALNNREENAQKRAPAVPRQP